MIKKIIILSAFPLVILFSVMALEAQSILSLFRISVDSSGNGGDQGSRNTSLSPNAELLVFESNSTNLVSSDTNSAKDIFVRNLSTNQTIRVNLGKNGEEADGNSQLAAVSSRTTNGLYAIAYESLSTNLTRIPLLPDNNNKQDIYISIPGLNSSSVSFTERVTLATGPLGFGTNQADGDSFKPTVAAVQNPDRLLVAYSSDATNLISSDTNAKRDIFLTTYLRPASFDSFDAKSMVSTVRISHNSTLGESDGDSDSAQISADGKFIVYESDSGKLFSGTTQGTKQIYMYNIATGTTSLISKALNGTPGNNNSISAAINFDATFITYLSKASNIISDGLVPNTQTYQVIYYNLLTGQSSRVNVSSAGALGNSTSDSDMSAKLSPDGRHVTFSDSSSNLADQDENSNTDVFVKDMQTGTLQLVSRALNGKSAAGQSTVPVLGALSFNTANAILPFTTTAPDMVTDDDEGQTDAYISQISIPALPLTKNASINVPPDITISGSNITATLKSYNGAQLKNSSRVRRLSAAKKKGKIKVSYLIRTFEDDPTKTKQKLVKQLTSKKNVVTVKNLKPGNYFSNYQARIVQGDKIKGKSLFSPDQRFTIN